jgi:hypothetical protein
MDYGIRESGSRAEISSAKEYVNCSINLTGLQRNQSERPQLLSPKPDGKGRKAAIAKEYVNCSKN